MIRKISCPLNYFGDFSNLIWKELKNICRIVNMREGGTYDI